MRSEHLVRIVGSRTEPLIDTYHDKIREVVLGKMSEKRRRGLHQGYADTIESQMRRASIDVGSDDRAGSDRVFDLAHHYSEAGDARAFDYQLLAGRASLDAYAVEAALEHLQKALEIRPVSLDAAKDFQLQFQRLPQINGCHTRTHLALAISKFSVRRDHARASNSHTPVPPVQTIAIPADYSLNPAVWRVRQTAFFFL